MILWMKDLAQALFKVDVAGSRDRDELFRMTLSGELPTGLGAEHHSVKMENHEYLAEHGRILSSVMLPMMRIKPLI
jgi:hypothetical protein